MSTKTISTTIKCAAIATIRRMCEKKQNKLLNVNLKNIAWQYLQCSVQLKNHHYFTYFHDRWIEMLCFIHTHKFMHGGSIGHIHISTLGLGKQVCSADVDRAQTERNHL